MSSRRRLLFAANTEKGSRRATTPWSSILQLAVCALQTSMTDELHYETLLQDKVSIRRNSLEQFVEFL